jgi:hypothetical protein
MKILVESCFHLDIKLLKKNLRLTREHKSGIAGFINILQRGVKTVADYSVEYGTENDYLVIVFDEEEQRIRLTESELHFGPRSWFVCDCDRRVSKLYLPPNSRQFKCRCCHKLSYELTTFNKKTKSGLLFYRTNRIIKMMNLREGIRSTFYKGVPTCRFNRFLNLSDRAGMHNIRRDAEKLVEAIKA